MLRNSTPSTPLRNVESAMAIPNAERQRAYRQRAAAALRAQTSTLVDTGLPDKTPPLQEAWDRASEEERQT
jgi:hypothetical protein